MSKKWNNLAKKLQDNFRVIYADEESFGIYVDLDGGRQQNVGFVITGIGKRQFIHMDSIICDRSQADLPKLIEMVAGLPIGGISLADNLVTLHHSIALETLDESISAYSSYDTIVYATIFMATKADEIQKILKIKDDSY
jgi:hypothetical protein